MPFISSNVGYAGDPNAEKKIDENTSAKVDHIVYNCACGEIHDVTQSLILFFLLQYTH